MNKTYRCGATNAGVPCGKHTSDPSGLCKEHRQEYEKYFSSMMLRCRQCAVNKECTVKGVAPGGVCYYELYDRSTDWADKEQLATTMKRVLRSEYYLHARIQRILAHQPGATQDDKLLNAFNKLSNNLFAHLEAYAKFRGWTLPKWVREDKNVRVEIIKKILEKDDENTQKELVINVPESNDPSDGDDAGLEGKSDVHKKKRDSLGLFDPEQGS